MTIRLRLAGLAAGIAIGAGTWCGLMAWAQAPPSRAAAKPAARAEPAVAVVGGRRISRSDFEKRVRAAEQDYQERAAAPVPAAFRATMRRQILEAMIREQLLTLEARRRGLTVTTAQAEEELKKDPFFQRGGMFDEAKFLAVKNTQAAQFQSALATIETQLPAIRLKQQLERENSPSAAQIKSELERQMSQVTIDFLALRRGAISATRPEPSEREVLEFYRAHAAEYPRPEQVTLTFLMVNRPALDPAQHGSPAAVQAWEARMKERADSLRTALAKGGKIDDLASAFGDLQREVRVTRDHFPEAWRGGVKAQQSVFSAAAGSLLGESVPSNNGFLVVRVDHHQPAHTASLQEIALTIRNRLREEMAQRLDDRELATLYATGKDSLRGPAYRVRYVVADTAVIPVAEPTAAELDRFYHGHLADYSFFDSKTSTVGAKTLAEVRDDVRRRLLQERRVAAARKQAEAVLALWGAGKRDPKLEHGMTLFREVGPIPVGASIDTGATGSILSDTLDARPGAQTNWMHTPRGWVVYQVFGEIKDYTPTLAEARSMLEARREPLHRDQSLAGARKLYDQDPARFRAADVVRFSRLMVDLPSPLVVPLSREEVVRQYEGHPDEYGAPELAHVRHILIVPKDTSPQADAAARAKAEDVMRRLKAGESFIDLAKKYSDDDATRDKGGDVGVFRHGMMLDDFERQAFGMQPGERRGPVKTEVGYHVIECIEHLPAEVTPLRYAYSTVAADAAQQKGERIARFRADSLRRVLHTAGQAQRAARAMDFAVYQNDHVIGSSEGAVALKDYFQRIDQLKPHQFDSEIQSYRGMGYAVSWVDSILPPRKASWNEVRDQALDLYQRESDRAAVVRKRAEFDSLLHAGWTFDSLATLFGGMERHGPHGPGSGLERLAGRELLDSLAFGTAKTSPVLEPGKVTPWIEFPGGWVMMRLVDRHPADPVQLAARIENESRGRLETNMRVVFDRLKERFPVRIEDSELRLTELPAPSGS